jgi:DNA-3-methyladenine glycosylase II
VLRRRPRYGYRHPAGLSASKADQHLREADPTLRRLIDAGGPITADQDRRGLVKDPYQALVRAIVGQQLSTRAAFAINERLAALLGEEVPSPARILAAEPDALREVGLSWPKVGYLRDLAERVLGGELDLERLPELPDEEVTAELIRIKGIGRWTAEMFLIFHLGRPDVISTGDLGIRRATQLVYGLDQLPGPAELERIAEPWRPHRTLACLYLWRSLHNQPV